MIERHIFTTRRTLADRIPEEAKSIALAALIGAALASLPLVGEAQTIKIGASAGPLHVSTALPIGEAPTAASAARNAEGKPQRIKYVWTGRRVDSTGPTGAQTILCEFEAVSGKAAIVWFEAPAGCPTAMR
jgi:hypothetical protein